MTYLMFAIGIVILLFSMLYTWINPKYTIIGCVVLLNMDFCFKEFLNEDSYRAFFKALILLSSLLLIIKTRKKIDKKIYIILLGIFGMSIYLCLTYDNENYNLAAAITSFASLFTGFLLILVQWGNNTRIMILRALSWLPLLDSILGIVVQGDFNRYSGLTGLHASHYLVFLAAMGMLASYILFVVYKVKGYWYLCLLNYMICGLCVMRGAFLFATIIMLGMLCPYLKSIPQKTLRKLCMMIPFFCIAGYFVLEKIFQKMFDHSYALGSASLINTSNRLYAWSLAWKQTEAHRILGYGIGYTKTMTGEWVRYGFQALHNEYLRFVIEVGYVGLLLMLLCLASVFAHMLKYHIGIPKSVRVAIILAFAVFSITDNTINGSAMWMLFMLMISIIMKDTKNEYESIPIIKKRITVILGRNRRVHL